MMRCGAAARLASIASVVLAAILPRVAGAAAEAGPPCDRVCLRGVADSLFASIAAQDATRLLLAPDYSATENFAPSVPAMMTVWRTGGAVAAPFYVIDPVTRQLFFVATLRNGGQADLLYGRLHAPGGRIDELELYVNRSRGQSGYMFDPDGPSRLGPAWTNPVPVGRRASRAELSAAGRSMFDTTAPAPPAAATCSVIETGQTARLDRTMQTTVAGSGEAGNAAPTLPQKTVPVSCAAVPHRPDDPRARADIVDEDQGIVVGIAVVRGTASAYLLGPTPESNFLPEGYYARYRALRDKARTKLDPNTPTLRPMDASAGVVQIYRMSDSKIQGFQRFIQVLPAGAVSPWRASSAQNALAW